MRALLFFLALCILIPAHARSQDSQVGSVVQLPTFGVAINSEGILALETFADPGGRIRAERMAAARVKVPGELLRPAKLRKISLRLLEAAIEESLREGAPLTDEIRYLAGLQRIQYVFVFEPESDRAGDIILAGPAEGWIADPSGRIVGATNGRPVVLLEDLAVALRAYPPGTSDHPFLGCTIDPTREGLARLLEFQKTIPRSISTAARQSVTLRILEGTRMSLGLADIRTFGISPQTHFAHVLIEADYRMKRIAIGAEPPPVPMVTFASALDSPRQAVLQRWWFTPRTDCVRATADRLSLELLGDGVKLQAEDIRIGASGELAAAGGKPSKPSQRYCDAFTNKYSEIAAVSPVYAQLRVMIDLAITAAYLSKHDLLERAALPLEVLRDDSAVPCKLLPEPKQVPCVSTAFWKRNRLICPAGGGVSIDAFEVLDDANIAGDENGELAQQRQQAAAARLRTNWWWD